MLKSKFLLTPFIFFCVSCSTTVFDPIYESVPVVWEEEPRYLPSKSVIYIKTENIQQTTDLCKGLNIRLKEGRLILACATLGVEPCIIISHYTEENMPIDLKNHELKHCNGYFHN